MDLPKLSEIFEGWRNKIVPPEALKEIIEVVSKERTSICEECPNHSKFHHSLRMDDHCTYCGCTLSAKTRCLSCKCPLDTPKWIELEVKIDVES